MMKHDQSRAIGLVMMASLSSLVVACVPMTSDPLESKAQPRVEPVARPLTPKEKAAVLLEQGVNKAVEGDYRSAIAVYSQAVQVDPNNSDAYYNRGVAYYYLGQGQKALQDFSQAIKLDPSFAEAYGNRGELRLRGGDRQGARQDFQQAATLFAQQGDPAAAAQMHNMIQQL